MANEKTEQEKKVVRERIPFGVPKSKMAINVDITGYHLHWVNDTPGRIFQAQQGGYEFVKPEEVGLSGDGERVTIHSAGVNEDGTSYAAYLMKIKQEWYEEDQKHLATAQDKFDEAIRSGAVNEKSSDNRYVPRGGISIRN